MSDNQGRAVGGSCLGGLLGGVLGIAAGAAIGGAGFEDKTGTPLDLINPCLGAFGALMGAALGGVLGAVFGSVMGAAMATSRSDEDEESAAKTDAPAVETAGQSDSAPESPDAELARLKERIAELEEKKRRESEP